MGYLLLATIAVIGFLASVVCHILGWLQIDPPLGKSVFVLHIGFLALWIPLVIFANKTMPPGAKSNFEHLLAEFPKSVQRGTTVLFVYTLFNFVYFMYCASQYKKHEVPFYLELRGFSGHWMLFYGMASLGFIALARLARKRKANGTVT